MKHIKLYETIVIDEILDKISDTGMDSLSDYEKDYLKSFKNKNEDEIDIEFREKKDEYIEPQNDPAIYDYDNYSDDDLLNDETDEEMLEDFWNSLPEEEFDEFIDRYNIPQEAGQTKWALLNGQIKTIFKNFLLDQGHI